MPYRTPPTLVEGIARARGLRLAPRLPDPHPEGGPSVEAREAAAAKGAAVTPREDPPLLSSRLRTPLSYAPSIYNPSLSKTLYIFMNCTLHQAIVRNILLKTGVYSLRQFCCKIFILLQNRLLQTLLRFVLLLKGRFSSVASQKKKKAAGRKEPSGLHSTLEHGSIDHL